ncbi:hypothetical protein AAFF_G00279390 [Aldrovandia affinis]|uniref:Uncharacterized protein n=1 Tax=Aldrovandia affinis TaxID=143900 RepID=A0AAD7SRM5_9TELE|nr:hypothetical protein AAFF_G00279390 [Aldrovandia affinis]
MLACLTETRLTVFYLFFTGQIREPTSSPEEGRITPPESNVSRGITQQAIGVTSLTGAAPPTAAVNGTRHLEGFQSFSRTEKMLRATAWRAQTSCQGDKPLRACPPEPFTEMISPGLGERNLYSHRRFVSKRGGEWGRDNVI